MSGCTKDEVERLFHVDVGTIWERRDRPKPPAVTYWTRNPDYIRITGFSIDRFGYVDEEAPAKGYAPIGIVDLFATYTLFND